VPVPRHAPPHGVRQWALAYLRPANYELLRIPLAGALTRMAVLERSALIAERLPLLARALPHVAHACDPHACHDRRSVAYADPAAELPACCLALDAIFVLAACVHAGKISRMRLAFFGTDRMPRLASAAAACLVERVLRERIGQ
jgi:CO/xanthine dehydrogenase FAD-binding subunit